MDAYLHDGLHGGAWGMFGRQGEATLRNGPVRGEAAQQRTCPPTVRGDSENVSRYGVRGKGHGATPDLTHKIAEKDVP